MWVLYSIKKAECQRIDGFRTVVLKKTLESPLDSKEIQPVHPKGDQSWVFIGRTDVEAETPILWLPHVKSWLIWKCPWCWGRWEVGAEVDDRGWDGWMASWTQWTWVWVNSGSWWWTGRPGVLWFMGSQSQTWLNGWTELNWTSNRLIPFFHSFFLFFCVYLLFLYFILYFRHWEKYSVEVSYSLYIIWRGWLLKI